MADRCADFGGNVDLDSVQACAVYEDEHAGKLSKVPVDESKIAPEDRIARVSSANWCARPLRPRMSS